MRRWFHAKMLTMLTVSTVVLIVAAYLPRQKQPDLSGHALTKPKVLFSLRYGEGDSQVGMFIPHPAAEDGGEPMGPSDFAVGLDGSIYIGDEQNGKVKKFIRDGRLLMITEGRIDRVAGMTVDRQGRIYVIHGILSNEVAVYDPKGRRMPEIEKKIMGAAERLRKELISTQPDLDDLVFRGFVVLPAVMVQCDMIGNLYFNDFHYIIKIDSEFRKAQIVKGFPYFPVPGFLYFYQLMSPEKQIETSVYDVNFSLVNRFLINALQRAEVTIYKSDGSIVWRLIIPKGECSELEKLVPIGISQVICDGRGHFYTLMSSIEAYHLPLRSDNPRFFVVSYYAVLEYDDEGKFVGIRAVINGPPMPSINWVEVDMHGNIYWLDFKSDHLDVMMAPVP